MKGKLKTPDWIIEGYKSKADWEKAKQKTKPLATSSKSQSKEIKSKKKSEKTFKVKKCPKCGSTEVSVVLGGEEGKGSGGWECKACKWTGKDVDEKEMSEDEFVTYFDKGEGK